MDPDRDAAMGFERVSDLFDRTQPQSPARLRELEADLEELDRMQAAASASEGVSGLAEHVAHTGMRHRRIPTRAGRRPECGRPSAGRS
jgi:hypothetical protein